jgi:hypothetical protein
MGHGARSLAPRQQLSRSSRTRAQVEDRFSPYAKDVLAKVVAFVQVCSTSRRCARRPGTERRHRTRRCLRAASRTRSSPTTPCSAGRRSCPSSRTSRSRLGTYLGRVLPSAADGAQCTGPVEPVPQQDALPEARRAADEPRGTPRTHTRCVFAHAHARRSMRSSRRSLAARARSRPRR